MITFSLYVHFSVDNWLCLGNLFMIFHAVNLFVCNRQNEEDTVGWSYR